MKRQRPYIPLSVRLAVANRQMAERGLQPRGPCASVGAQLNEALYMLFGHGGDEIEAFQLDHDPALILRHFNPRSGKYMPRANDPAHLVYRTKADHLQKTTGRKADAEKTVTTKGSDIWLKSKFARLEGRTKKRPKVKIQSRGFSKQKRKFRS